MKLKRLVFVSVVGTIFPYKHPAKYGSEGRVAPLPRETSNHLNMPLVRKYVHGYKLAHFSKIGCSATESTNRAEFHSQDAIKLLSLGQQIVACLQLS